MISRQPFSSRHPSFVFFSVCLNLIFLGAMLFFGLRQFRPHWPRFFAKTPGLQSVQWQTGPGGRAILLVRFATPMYRPNKKETDRTRDWKQKILQFSPKLKYTFSWETPTQLQIIPRNLAPGQVYQFAPNAGTQDAKGDPLFPRSLRIKTAALQVTGVRPAQRMTDTMTQVCLRFNGAIALHNWHDRIVFRSKGKGVLYSVKSNDDEWIKSRDGQVDNEAIFLLTHTADLHRVQVQVKAFAAGNKQGFPETRGWRGEIVIPDNLEVGSADATVKKSRISIDLEINSQLNYASALHWIDVKPAVKGLALFPGRHFGVCTLRGEFDGATLYTICVRQGLTSVNGRRLMSDQTRSVITPTPTPGVGFLTSGPFLAGNGRTRLALRVAQTDTVQISARPVYPRNLINLISESGKIRPWASRDITGKIRKKELTVPVKQGETGKNKLYRLQVPVDQILKDAPFGLYLLSANVPQPQARYRYWYYSPWWGALDQRVVVVWSSMLLTLVTDKDGVHAWVTDRRSHLPVEGAEVELISNKNQILGRCLSNQAGLAVIRDFASLSAGEKPRLVVARRGDDLTLLPIAGEYRLPLPEAARQDGRVFTQTPYEAFLYTDRDLCRPGEQLRFSGQIRERDNLTAAGGFPARLLVQNPKGRSFLNRTLTIDNDGFVSLSITIPRNAATGEYVAKILAPGRHAIRWGQCHFLVAAYTPERIRLNLTTDHPGYRNGDRIRVTGQADYYFGRPASGCTAELTLRYTPKAFHSPKYAAFTFAAPLPDTSMPRPFHATAKTDNKGRASFNVHGPTVAGIGNLIEISARLTVKEPGGRPITRVLTRPLAPVPICLGLRAVTPSKLNAANLAAFEWIALDPLLGTPVKTSRPLKYEWYRICWVPVFRADKDKNFIRTWERKRQLVNSGVVPLSNHKSKGTLQLAWPGHSLLELHVFLPGTPQIKTILPVAHGADNMPVRPADAGVLVVKRDQSHYLPGAAATFHFTARGPGQVLICIGDNKVSKIREQVVVPGENTVKIKVPNTVFGSAYVALYLLEHPPTRPGIKLPENRYAILPLNLDQNRHLLQVKIKAPERVLPETETTVQIQLHADGKPVDGRVQLFAVDEGVLAITQYTTPDPFAYFFGPRICGFRLYACSRQVFPDVSDLPGFSKISSIGGDAGRYRSFINPQTTTTISLYSGVVHVPASGRQEIKLRIPSFSGALRLMAVAFSSDRVGSAQRQLQVRDVFTMQSTGPKAVAPGDRFEISAHLFNNDLPASTALVGAVVESGPITVLAAKSVTCRLPRGSDRTVSLAFQAKSDTVDTARLRIRCALGKRVFSEPLVFAVRPVNPPTDFADIVTIQPGKAQTIQPTTKLLAGSIDFSLRATPFLSTDTGPALAWLRRYPYGCVEQTTSGALPFLYVQTTETSDKARNTPFFHPLQKAIHRISRMQQYNGGFSMWLGGSGTWDAASIYAAFFLEAAHRRGLQVDPLVRKNVLAYLRFSTRTPDQSLAPLYIGLGHYLLARADKGNPQAAERFIQNCGPRHTGARVLAALALQLSGHARPGKRALDLALKDPIWDEPTRKSLDSPVARIALSTIALEQVLPESPAIPRLIQNLRQRRNLKTHWGSTIQNALAAAAILKWDHLNQKGSKTRGTAAWQPAAKQTAQITREISAAAPLSLRFKSRIPDAFHLSNQGPGPLYVSWFARGVARGPQSAYSRGGLKIQRTYVHADGRPGRHFQQGEVVHVVINLDITTLPFNTNIAIIDLLPGGLQIDNFETLRAARKQNRYRASTPFLHFIEPLDDRVLLFGRKNWMSNNKENKIRLEYTCRAVVRGAFTVPTISAEAMYHSDIRACTTGGKPLIIQ